MNTFLHFTTPNHRDPANRSGYRMKTVGDNEVVRRSYRQMRRAGIDAWSARCLVRNLVGAGQFATWVSPTFPEATP